MFMEARRITIKSHLPFLGCSVVYERLLWEVVWHRMVGRILASTKCSQQITPIESTRHHFRRKKWGFDGHAKVPSLLSDGRCV
jgi:hypothetical protein